MEEIERARREEESAAAETNRTGDDDNIEGGQSQDGEETKADDDFEMKTDGAMGTVAGSRAGSQLDPNAEPLDIEDRIRQEQESDGMGCVIACLYWINSLIYLFNVNLEWHLC